MKQKKHCKHVKTDGQACRAWAGEGSEYCFSHDPETRREHQLATVKGGSVRQFKGELSPVVLSGPEDVCGLLAQTINELRAGEVPPQVANSIGYLAGQLTRAFETTILARKIARIELIVERN